MRYALVRRDTNQVVSFSDLESAENYIYDEDFYYVVEAPGFDPDLERDLFDYVYFDGEIYLDEDGIAERELNRAYEPYEVIAALLQQTEVLDSLPDDTLAHMAPYMAKWQDGIAYAIGDKVQYQERPYRCVQAHTSTQEWNPADAVSLWARILVPSPDVIPEWEQPESTNPYMKGDKVRHNGKVWVSDIDYNVFEPGVACWTEVPE